LKRFDTITLKIWQRHGIERAGFWTSWSATRTKALYYLLKWDSLADREKKWNTFQPIRNGTAARRDRSKRPIVQRVATPSCNPPASRQ